MWLVANISFGGIRIYLCVFPNKSKIIICAFAETTILSIWKRNNNTDLLNYYTSLRL